MDAFSVLMALVVTVWCNVCTADPVVVAGGLFSTAGGTPAQMIAEWHGSPYGGDGQWKAMDNGLNGPVFTLTEFQGHVFAGGKFSSSGLASAVGVAKWDGVQWSSVGSGVMNDDINRNYPEYCFREVYYESGTLFTPAACFKSTESVVLNLFHHNGKLAASGHFTLAGKIGNAGSVALWNGNDWEEVGYLPTPRPKHVRAACSFAGSLYTTEDTLMSSSGPSQAQLQSKLYKDFALHSGSSGIGQGNGEIVVLSEFSNLLVAAGRNLWAATAYTNIAYYDQSAQRWTSFFTGAGTPSETIRSLTRYGAYLVAGGEMSSLGYIAQWDGVGWSRLGSGMNDFVYALASWNDQLFAAGKFTKAGDVNAAVAVWNGESWADLGDGLGFNGVIRSLLVYNYTGGTPVPTPTPTQAQPSTPVPTTTPPLPEPECSLTTKTWRAQYLVDDDVLVEDRLAFMPEGVFTQNQTVFPHHECYSNWVHWTGDYDHLNATALLLSYMRCTPSTDGCLRCGPTKEEWTNIKFSVDCDVLMVTHSDLEMHTYYHSDVLV